MTNRKAAHGTRRIEVSTFFEVPTNTARFEKNSGFKTITTIIAMDSLAVVTASTNAVADNIRW